MKKFMMLMVGFETPTSAIMTAWRRWFESIAERQLDRGALMNGREISRAGVQELPMDRSAVTGYVVIHAENLDEAMRIAEQNPYIESIRVYEIMGKA
ncbi:MAG: hypothetical protein ACFB9M_00410 [Myxococcota bacterium]